jgi:hypothetical protein
MQTTCSADGAGEYLRRIAALTGAELAPGDSDSYCMRVGRKIFLVDNEYVRVFSRRRKSTCFSVARNLSIPEPEVIASALLHLKNNPKMVKKWRKHPGCAFKANGKRFKTRG